MIHTKKEVKTEIQLIYYKYKIPGDMKLAVKIFEMGNKRIINITQHNEKAFLTIWKGGRKSKVHVIKAKEIM